MVLPSKPLVSFLMARKRIMTTRMRISETIQLEFKI
jgi:hypothetical protein